eukprot:5549267-Prymnesium_polylepis.1
MRRETRDRRRSSFIHPPEHAADDPRPTQPTLPHKAVRRARARSSQLHLGELGQWASSACKQLGALSGGWGGV